MTIDFQIPLVFKEFFELGKYRYKNAWGGRGGGKTENIARILILLSFKMKGGVILCVREIMNSLEDSVYKVLLDILREYEIEHFFDVTKKSITNKETGVSFIFKGLKDTRSNNSIKSTKGVKICWIEEAHSVSYDSLRVLLPTIRENDSEIWTSFNRSLRLDPVFDVCCNKDNSLDIQVNLEDNPFAPKVLLEQREYDYQVNPTMAKHVWGGEPKPTGNASVFYNFNREISLVKEPIKYNPSAQLWSFWDFGMSDSTAIIIAQIFNDASSLNGVRIEILDYYENSRKPPEHYKDWLKSQPYFNANMRHAGDPNDYRSTDLSLTSWFDRLQPEIYMEVPQTNKIEELTARANEYMPAIRINEVQNTRLIDIIEQWNYPVDRITGNKIVGAKPVHNELSHGGTALYYGIMTAFPSFGSMEAGFL